MLKDDDVAKVMLTLAAIAYRGINLILPEQLKRLRLRQLMDECIATFSAVKGKWEIVWGPASFSTVSPGLDDALMYVVRCLKEPSALTIAIRGTNPLSATDWIFGDLMVTQLVPWSYGDRAQTPNASVSASTMIGLGVLQYLTSSDSTVSSSLPSPSSQKSVQTESGVVDLKDLLQVRLGSRVSEILETLRSTRASERSDLLNVPPRSRTSAILETLKSSAAAISDSNFNPFNLLRGRLGAIQGSERSLWEVLSSHVSSVSNPEIYVTGHSKGGALSSTTALWLRDTQGQGAPDSWDPQGKAKIYCYSFAGPTAGNEGFANHSDAALGENCRRVWNRRDLVPRAFVSESMRQIPTLYVLRELEKQAIGKLVERVANQVAPFHYKQICGDGFPIDCDLLPGLSFSMQVIHQHLDAYFQHFGLDNEMSTAKIFAPVLP